MASLAQYFEELNVSTEGASQERLITKCLFNQHSTSTSIMPRFDEEFSMTHETAQRVLKSLITFAECLQKGNLESFWLIPGLDTTCKKTETQAKKDENCCNAKEIALLSPNQDTMKKHQPSEKNSPKVLKVYTHKKFWRGKTQVSLGKNEKPFESESSGEQNEHNNCSTQERDVPMSLDDADGEDAPPLKHAIDSDPGCVFTVDREKQSRNHDASEENQGIVRWGVRKKITSRCRSNTFSDESRSKGPYFKEDKQHQHKGAKTGHESNAYKHVMLTGIGKGKMLKVPKLMEGRWSTERYKAAQLKLFEIMKDKGAVPGKPLLRPALRVEARKHIGDTGLLDHLLKHMTDTVINDGERFRRRHNSEGAMEYWLEDARLQELRKQAGVDQYWIPPSGWKIGDIITNSENEGMSSFQLTELKRLREEVEKLKSQLQYVCLHVGASLLQSKSCASNFQSWKTIEESITKAQKDSHPALQPADILQANAVADNTEKEKAYRETHEMRKIVAGQACDKRENESGDEITFFYKAAARPGSLNGKPGEGLTKAKQGTSEKKSPGSTVLRRNTKETENKENMSPMDQPSELITKAFQVWKKTQGFSQREVLSAISANVESSLCKSL